MTILAKSGAALADAIRYADSPNMDAFGRLRVSEPLTLFDSKQVFDNQPLFWDESLESGAGIASAHDINEASTVITSTVSTAGVFTRQTFERFNYQPGKSQLVYMTGILDRSGGGTGVERRIGLFDDNNGLFFEDDAGTIGVTRRTNVTGTPADNTVVQANWNVDVMDGSGPSGITIDWTFAQLFFLDFEWLSVGRVRMGLVVNGETHVVHQFLGANVRNKVYMSTPNLPLRYQMVTTGGSPASTMECICATIISEGGQSNLGVLRSKENGGLGSLSAGTAYALLGVRLQSAKIAATVLFAEKSLLSTTPNDICRWSLIFNGTIAGTPSWADEANSTVQTFVGTTAETISGGIRITGGFFSTDSPISADLENALRLGATIAGVPDTIVLAVIPITNNITVHGSLTWREVS